MWGIGPLLLVEALRCAEAVSRQIGVSAVHLAYTDEGRVLYEEYGYGPHPFGDGWLLMSMNDVRRALASGNERDDE